MLDVGKSDTVFWFKCYQFHSRIRAFDLVINKNNIYGFFPPFISYLMMSIYPYQFTADIGTINVYFNHFGEWNSPSRSYMDKLKNFRPDIQRQCFYKNASSLWDYEKDAYDPLYTR